MEQYIRKIITSKNPYVFDMDENGMLALTEKNKLFIEAILAVDSNYRAAETGTGRDSSRSLFEAYGITTDYAIIFRQIAAVDRENSTHLSASGPEKGDNNGREIAAEAISKIQDLEVRLSHRDPGIVQEIASANPKRKNFSFASKFCTYAARYALPAPQNDGYCIYDQVLSEVLPYYAYRYLGERHIAKKNSIIGLEIAEKCDYKGYIDLIDRIIAAASQETGYTISHKDFDHLLWYYYKGNQKERVDRVAILVNKMAAMV